MIVLGLSPYTNPAACLFVGGRLTAFAEEERFTRVKGSHHRFPGESLKYCLAQAGLSLDEVDLLAIPYDAPYYPLGFLKQVAGAFLRGGSGGGGGLLRGASTVLGKAFHNSAPFLKARLREGLRAHGIAGRLPKVEFVNHHLSHAASACAFSGFDSALALVVDGSGANCCTALYDYEKGALKLLEEHELPHSLGWFYAGVTEFLGFAPYQDEGRTMGLAPYGKSAPALREKLAKVLTLEAGGYRVDPSYLLAGRHSRGVHFSDRLVDLFGEPRGAAAPLLERHQDLAWEAQDLLETAVKSLVRAAVSRYGKTKVCVAGGVGLNCKMNGALLEGTGAKDVFVFPAANDAGACVGAAWLRAGAAPERLEHAYYGPEFSAGQVKAALDEVRMPYTEPGALPEEAARLLARGCAVGWFQGRMEFGPRALGHRSILANPLAAGIKDRLNAKVKFREAWRPFCPSVLDESRGRYMSKGAASPFMTVAHRLRPGLERLASIAHVDGSMRPQTVTRESNPDYHALLSAFGRLTGEDILLNTSLNVMGEPICHSPRDALRCFSASGLDALAIGPFLLEKAGRGGLYA